MLNHILAFIGGVIGLLQGFFGNLSMWCWLRPVTMAQITSMLFNFGFLNAMASVAILVGDFIFNLILVNLHDRGVWMNRIQGCYFREFTNCRFEKVSLRLPDISLNWRAMLSSPFASFFLRLPIRAFYVRASTGTGPS